MSSSVVTPHRSAVSSAPGDTWVCASTRPGRRVAPRPSTTGVPGGGAGRPPTAAIRPSRTNTGVAGWNRSPSKTVAPSTRKLPDAGAPGPPVPLSPDGATARTPTRRSSGALGPGHDEWLLAVGVLGGGLLRLGGVGLAEPHAGAPVGWGR